MKPNNEPAETLCEEIKEFFDEKVEKIYSTINNDTAADILLAHLEPFQDEAWSRFETIGDTDLKKILSDLNKKECEEDPILLKLLMQCLDEVKPMMSFIINDSLVTGKFPSVLSYYKDQHILEKTNKFKCKCMAYVNAGKVNCIKKYKFLGNLSIQKELLELFKQSYDEFFM